MGFLRDAIVHCHHPHDAATRDVELGAVSALWFRRSVHVIALDQPPLPAWSPVLHETLESVIRVLLRVLLPVWIVVPDPVSLFVILLLEGREKVIDLALFGVVAEVPSQDRAHQYDGNDGDDPVALLASSHGIVRRSFEQGHNEYSLLRRTNREAVSDQRGTSKTKGRPLKSLPSSWNCAS